MHLLAAMSGGRYRECLLRVVALERLGEIGLVEFAAAAPLDLERGGVGRKSLDEPVTSGIGGLEADAATPRAFAQGQHENEALGIGHPGLLRELAHSQVALTVHAEGLVAVPAEVALLAILGLSLFTIATDSQREQHSISWEEPVTSSKIAVRIAPLTDSIARQRSVLLGFAIFFLKGMTRSSAFMMIPRHSTYGCYTTVPSSIC